MDIILHKHYENVNGIKIKPGQYVITDARLGGLGRYLVDNGHATIVETELTDIEHVPGESLETEGNEPVVEEANDEDAHTEIEALNMDEIKAALDVLGVEYNSQARKAELVALLAEARTAGD